MTKSSLPRLAGWSGIIFVVLSLVITVLVPPLPRLDQIEAEVFAYYHGFGGRFLLGNYLAMCAAVPSFVFFSCLVLQLKEKEGSGGWLWIAVLTTMIVAHAVGAVDLFLFQMTAYAGGQFDAPNIKLLADLACMGFGFFFLTQAAFAAYTAWGIFVTRAFAPVHAWIGVATAISSLLASLGTVMTQGVWTIGGPLTAPGFLIFFVWVLGLSGACLRK